MWAGFQTAVEETLPNVHYVLDRFHLVKYVNMAIDETRKEEVKIRPELKKQKYTLLKNEANLTTKQKLQFDHIKAGNFLVSRAWVVKENFKALFIQKDFASAAAIFEHWLYETSTYTIKAIKKVREMFLKHKIGIINALCNKVSNGYAERMNGAIHELKTIAKGFSKVDSFRTSILFYYGKLHLMPT